MTGTMSSPPSAAANATLVQIQRPVRDRLDQVATAMYTVVTADLPLIQSVSGHLLATRGKMFRPTLALLCSAADDTPEPRSIMLGAAIELMHLATLVHDDSVDHSVLRRGLPTVNSMFSHQISVIMGDFLYSRALSALVGIGDLEIVRILTETSNELSIGEMRQLAAVDRLSFGEQEYYQLIRAKTACLIAAACETGAMCGANRLRGTLERFGDRLGMAFQVADDILDYTENQSVTGKPGGLDLKEHKVTLPLIAVLPTLSAAARARVDALFAEESPDDASVAEVIGLVIEAGGVDEARRRGARFAEEAEEALAELPETPVRDALRETIGYVMQRRS
jgi:octaprenyl-diphosphate synthase